MENKPRFHPDPKLKLIEQVCEVLRYHHTPIAPNRLTTSGSCYIHFTGGNIHPRDLGAGDVERFLSDLTVKQKVAASTQRQALNAIVFSHAVEVLDKPLRRQDCTNLVQEKTKNRPR